MENSPEPAKPTSTNQPFPLGSFLKLAVVALVILGGCHYVSSFFTKRHLLKYAREQLGSQNYTVVNLVVKEFHNPNKLHAETGKLDFVVRNGQGVTYEGTADIVEETHWLVFDKQVFRIIAIHEKK